jgi:hypothetical protein
MRRITMTAMALAVALGWAAMSSTADAAQTKPIEVAPYSAVQPVRYGGHHRGPHYRHGRDDHAHWRDHRRARDEARIAEAARREAQRIERERAARRAWHAQQRQYSHYRGW